MIFAKVSKELQSWVFSNPRFMLRAPHTAVRIAVESAAAAARLKGEPHVQLFVAKKPQKVREREMEVFRRPVAPSDS